MLGLNGVQARAYLTLIRLGPAKAKEIARASSIARPDIYRTISKLQELGLVEKVIATPARFQAVPIADALVVLFRRRGMQSEMLRKNAAILQSRYREVEKSIIQKEKEGSQFVLIPKKEPVVLNIQKLAENAEKEICYMIPLKKLLPLVINYSDIFKNALERNVKLQIITEKPEKGELLNVISELNKNPNFEIRLVSSPLTVHFGLFDDCKILLSTSAKASFAESPSIYSNNPDVLELARSYFEIEWITAMETNLRNETPTKEKKRVRKANSSRKPVQP
jgi:sugar-specific transcriptional regulator TrmB